MPPKYIDVVVEEHEALPEGCELRFHAVGASRGVERVLYEPLTGGEAEFTVVAAAADGTESAAQAAPVDDSGAGTSNPDLRRTARAAPATRRRQR